VSNAIAQFYERLGKTKQAEEFYLQECLLNKSQLLLLAKLYAKTGLQATSEFYFAWEMAESDYSSSFLEVRQLYS